MQLLDFPVGEWFNVSRPLTTGDLKGRVAVLDFWTYCCINCHHLLASLELLEREHPDDVVVVGVHSPKFSTEHEARNVREAVLRYNIKHPVFNDPEMLLWRQYGIQAWPSLLFIGPTGELLGQHSGEVPGPLLLRFVERLLGEHSAQVHPRPLPLAPETDAAAASPLSFPGKLAVAEERLYISDSGHNRVLATDLEGHLQRVYEGDFSRPQGVAVAAGQLYVADTEHHLIKRVDVESGAVTVLAGTGEQGVARQVSAPGPELPISSPWDVELVDGRLFIAMAGTHQLWVLDLASGFAADWAGTGEENISDGPLKEAKLAQPSGICSDGRVLYFADSETSSVRSAALNESGGVRTIVGRGLFDFGDVDGIGGEVRLQHPLGVCTDGLFLYLADTYNNRIKRVFPSNRGVTTLAGSGTSGRLDGQSELAEFNEPGGLAVAGGQLYIADTNNALIRVCDLETTQVRTLTIS
ncbi:MAG: thioredoxin-like domain-containing protein [Chloroflexota bacterium]